MADEAEAVFIDAARREKMQLVHHVVVATDEGTVDPSRLEDRQFKGSFQELPTVPVIDEDEVASSEAHRKRASGDVVGTQIPVELHVEVADRLVVIPVARSSANGVDPRR